VITVPSLDDLAADPAKAASLSADVRQVVLGRALGVILACATVTDAPPLTAAQAAPSKFAERLTLTTAEAAEWTGLDETHVQELCRRGVIPAAKPGKAWLIRVDAVREWLAGQEEAQRRANQGVAPTSATRSDRSVAARLGALPKNSRRSP